MTHNLKIYWVENNPHAGFCSLYLDDVPIRASRVEIILNPNDVPDVRIYYRNITINTDGLPIVLEKRLENEGEINDITMHV